jgi:sulfite reductase (NADPH) flavoprotein alpha-component
VSISGDDGGVCNFLAILDQGLLKSHSLLKYAKRGASILIATSWLVPELVSNPSTEAVSLFRDEGLHLYINDARSMAFDVGPHGE